MERKKAAKQVGTYSSLIHAQNQLNVSEVCYFIHKIISLHELYLLISF